MEAVIEEMKTSASPGPDGIGTNINRMQRYISTPLQILWRKSLDTGEILEILNVANITSIFIRGSKKEPKNYGPISLTCNFIKFLERILKKCVIIFLEDNQFMKKS